MESIKTEQTKECDSLKDEPSVNDRDDLKVHSLSKSVKQKHHCDQCDYQTYRNYDLKNHIQSKHKGVKYSCNTCDLRFTFKSSLNTHIHTKHEGVKHLCDQCGQKFG